ncbi:VOC family protein [Roseovarius sp. M141]|uniref:VOC family protein n=1 Tax=Roseovarius sp. M141 TaxID=2583806 RepID=UPI0020CD050E|nr:VOC family protein [Roseovarius sp. M141]MCQ0090236.1 VOC family protein [Roseovarius sp. M141]
MKLAHISITARSADRLSAFYTNVFGCEEMRPPRTLSGEAVSRGNGLPRSVIYSIWLRFPDQETPFLELLEYESSDDRLEPGVDEIGISHLSFQLDNIQSIMTNIVKAGGSTVGEITNFGTIEEPFLIVYMRDCEGNILELEQPAG